MSKKKRPQPLKDDLFRISNTESPTNRLYRCNSWVDNPMFRNKKSGKFDYNKYDSFQPAGRANDINAAAEIEARGEFNQFSNQKKNLVEAWKMPSSTLFSSDIE